MRARIYGMEGTTLGTVELEPGVNLRDLAKRARRFELFFDAVPEPPAAAPADADDSEPRPQGLELDEPPAPGLELEARPQVLEATPADAPAQRARRRPGA